MSSILKFPKSSPKPDVADSSTQSIKVGDMVRVVNESSPFFMWEGHVTNFFSVGIIYYCQIFCAHNGFHFPVFTFAITEIEPCNYDIRVTNRR